MSDLADRVRALERAVTDHDDPLALPDVARLADDVAALQRSVEELDAEVTAVAARQHAVEGYADRVEHVNEAVERRANAALAAVDRLEAADDSGPSVAPARGDEAASRSVADAAAADPEPEPSSGWVARFRDAL